MTRLLHRPKRDEDVLLAACTTKTARTAPAVPPEPGIAAQVLFDLRADDARDTSLAAARALLRMPLRDPAADSQPIEALLDRAQHVMRSRDLAFEAVMAEDRVASAVRCEAIAAAVRTDDAVGAQLAAVTADVAAALTARPALRHDHAVLMHLAPVVAMLKGAVA